MSVAGESLKENRGTRWRFGLRWLLLATLLVATYCAGWQSHKLFHNRNLKENIAAAMQEINSKNVEVETIQDLGLTIVKGNKQSVEDTRAIIDQIHAAASK